MTRLCLCVKGLIRTHNKLVKDLQTISMWAYQWKIVFNPDMSKQAIEIIFSGKSKKPYRPDLTFNGIPIARVLYAKHLGIYLDTRLNFSKHIKEKVSIAMRGIALLKLLSTCVDCNVLALSYTMYIQHHLDYGDVI